MTSPDLSRTRYLPGRPAAAGVVVLSALGLAGLGCSPALATSSSSPSSLASLARFGAVNPSDYLQVTGATGYANALTAPLRSVPVATTQELSTALRTARAGDSIVVAAGTYAGRFALTVSGTREHPIVVAPAAGAAVTLTAPLKYPSCGATGPDSDRTVSFTAGASHWVLRGLTIDGGVILASKNADNVQSWQSKAISTHSWATRRSVPGAASWDAVAARGQVPFLAKTVGAKLYPSQDIQLLDNTITGKGVFGRMAVESVISGNTISDVACGTGPALWLANYSRANVISGNTVARVAVSTASHYMQEGIRLGNGSDYNAVVGNRVRDLPANGRGITTDQDSSWNLITQNRVNSVDIAYNEQQSGWGNTWSYNIANHARVAAFSFRMEDVKLATPSRDTSSFLTQVRCNTAFDSAVDLQAGAVSGGSFSSNQVRTWSFNQGLLGYWASVGNLWNGSSSAPSVTSPVTTVGC
ncbi:MAG: hypothetical protein M3Y71_00625 [Actinomycetota bacterium]|nr:hypothetical protein [Actinomycetota bacterium]